MASAEKDFEASTVRTKDPAREMARWIEALAPKPNNLRSIPRAHTVVGEKQLPADCPLTSCCDIQINRQTDMKNHPHIQSLQQTFPRN